MLHADRYSKPCFRVHGAHSVRNKLLREASIYGVFISIFISFMVSKCYMYNNAAYNLFLGFLISPKQLQGELLELSRFCSFSYTSKFSSNLAFKILSLFFSCLKSLTWISHLLCHSAHRTLTMWDLFLFILLGNIYWQVLILFF